MVIYMAKGRYFLGHDRLLYLAFICDSCYLHRRNLWTLLPVTRYSEGYHRLRELTCDRRQPFESASSLNAMNHILCHTSKFTRALATQIEE
jgi:hypothetical protein